MTRDDVDLVPSTSQRFVFRREVCTRIGVSYVTLWTWMREGKFPRSREVGGQKIAWLESEIDDWMNSRPVRKFKGEKVA